MTVPVTDASAWIIVPARGGSRGVPRKNLRLIGDQPLINHVLKTAVSVVPSNRVVVVTDDHEVVSRAAAIGVVVVIEDQQTPSDETLDTKIIRNLPMLRKLGASEQDVLLTVQPTSPLIQSDTIREAIRQFDDPGCGSVVTVVPDQHLRWRMDKTNSPIPLFTERRNRQELPPEYRETGGLVGARLSDIENHQTRIVNPVVLLPVDEEEAVDIDTFSDLYAAAHLLTIRRIAIRVDAATHLGMGHVYRSYAIANELARHSPRVFTLREHELGGQFFRDLPITAAEIQDESEFFEELSRFQPELVVLDILNTTSEYQRRLRSLVPGVKIVTFEDLGSGALEADLLVAEFVRHPQVPLERQMNGIMNSILAPSFEGVSPAVITNDEVEQILVLFGGTDPAGLADRVLASLERLSYRGRTTVIRGLGAAPLENEVFGYELDVLSNVRYMPGAMQGTDLAFTSAGRTVVELASLGIPSLCIGQNEKEMTHTHATVDQGVNMIGLASELTEAQLDDSVATMLTSRESREELRSRAVASLRMRSNRQIMETIMRRLGFEPTVFL